jgi:hypothetical protein
MPRDWPALYRLQDWVLMRLRHVSQGFYLTGGTALSRGYYEHRYSDDLDFFVNDVPDFELWRDRCLDALEQGRTAEGLRLEILLREKRFGRAMLHGPVPLKLEFINDVPFRVGQPWEHPRLGRLDTKENILANKVSALVDRQEPKDLADIFWLCCRDNLDLLTALKHASGKAAGLFPPTVAKALQEALSHGVPTVFWQQKPEAGAFTKGIEGLIERLVG